MERGIPARLTPSEGRRFALPVAGAFAALAGLAWWRGHLAVATAVAAVAGLLFLAGLLVPRHLGPVYRAWMGFALLLSKVTTPIFMGIVFFFVITPVGLAMRIFGRNPVVRKESAGSFWVSRPTGPDRHSDLRRQF